MSETLEPDEQRLAELRELVLNTMASWAMEGLYPSAEFREELIELVEGRISVQELGERTRKRYGLE